MILSTSDWHSASVRSGVVSSAESPDIDCCNSLRSSTSSLHRSCIYRETVIMGRSILAVLLATILAISRMSINPTPSACQSLFIIFAPRHHCCLAAVSKVEGAEGHWVNKGRAKLLRLQQVDCHWGEVLIESRLWLSGTAMSVSDHTLDVLLDHLLVA